MGLVGSLWMACLGFSQTGPAGVGSTDGSSNLVLWLHADTETGTSGSVLSTWNDRSGYGHHFTAGNGAVFQAASQNGYAAFAFNGSSHYFQRAFTAALTPSTFSIFSATNVTSSNRYKAVISNRDDPPGSATAGFILYSRPSNNQWQFWTGRSSGSWQVTTGNVSTAGSWAGQTMLYAGGSNGKRLFVNSNLNATSSHTMTLNPNRPIRVGAGRNENTTPNYYFQGAMGEVIMYNTVVNDAQRIILENYLAAKYAYTLAANDLYDGDNAANGNFDHEVAGIGRVNASHLHDDAQGTGIIRMNNPTDLGNNEFLLWGHDNGALSLGNSSDVPSSVQARLNRVWRVSEATTGGGVVDVGGVDILVDMTGLSRFSTSYPPQLLVDTDNDGSFGDETPILGADSLGSNIYRFNGVTGLSDNLRFTFGIGFQTIITNRRITYRIQKD
ncbi:MAG: hypothetical protein AB3N16_04735 [Flavobacteriaceae bacterium]